MERKSIAVLSEKLTEIKSLAPQDAEVNRKVKLSVDPSLKHVIGLGLTVKCMAWISQ